MEIQRLSWAGVKATVAGFTVLVDPLEDTTPFRAFAGPPARHLEPVPVDGKTWALVTHMHPDHCDRGVLRRVPQGQVLCHSPVARALSQEGIETTPVDLWHSVRVGPFELTPVPAEDWRSDDQVAWVIKADSMRAIHAGDTMWHGQWYAIARRFAPLDVALLPINGFIARLDGFTATDVPGSLTPEQAIEAAVILEAKLVGAIHHSLFNNPPFYTQQTNAIDRFLDAATRRGINAVVPGDGEIVTSSAVEP